MSWSIDDHKASAQEALDRGLISGNIDHLADVPEPQQASEHQARVATLQVLNAAVGSDATITDAWVPWAYQTDPPVDPPTDPSWGDGAAFGSRPDASGPGVISGEDGVVIENLGFEGSDYIWQSGRAHNAHVPIRIINSRS